MTSSILIVMAMLFPQQQLEQQVQRLQQQIEQFQREFQQQGQVLLEMRNSMQRREQQEKPLCSAEMRWANGGEPKNILAPGASAVVQMSLFSIVSKPSAGCLPAEIRVTASYLDAADILVCTGVIENLAVQSALAQSINLEIRPWNLREFVRWRNEPPQVNSGAKRLPCVNPDGLAEATTEELSRVVSVRVRATVLPVNGGMSTQEALLRLR